MIRVWSNEDTKYAIESWGKVSLEKMSKKLNRTPGAIEQRLKRVGRGGGAKINSEYISLRDISKALYGYCYDLKIKQMIDKGLKVREVYHRNSLVKCVDIHMFWKWAEKNKDILDFSKLEKHILGVEPAWVDSKRIADKRNKMASNRWKEWTMYELDYLFLLKKNGKTNKEIAAELNRTPESVRGKYSDLYKKKQFMKRR